MSTTASIKWRERTAEQPVLHLYDDMLDKFNAGKQEEPPVYLRLDGVCASLETLQGGGANLTATLPPELARASKLLPAVSPTNKDPDSRGL